MNLPYKHSQYNATYDFGGMKKIDAGSMFIMQLNLDAYSSTIYKEANDLVTQ
jgi:hypothetical protein